MDRKTIEERMTLPILSICLAVAGSTPGAIDEAKRRLLDIVEDLTKEAVTDAEFEEIFGPADKAVIRPARDSY